MKKITKQYLVSVYDDGTVRVTERALAKRDKAGRFTSPYSIRFRARVKRTCAYAEICPFAM